MPAFKPYVRTLADQIEFDRLVAEIRASRPPPKPNPVCPDGMSKEDFIMSLQLPHVQRVMKMSEVELEEYRARPMPENWLANPDAKTNDESVGKRNLDPDEIAAYTGMRHASKNTIGQSEKSATTPESRERAVQGLIFTPPAKVTPSEVQAKAVNLVQYKSEPLKEVWVEIPWYKALMHKLTGGTIRSETKK